MTAAKVICVNRLVANVSSILVTFDTRTIFQAAWTVQTPKPRSFHETQTEVRFDGVFGIFYVSTIE